MRTGWATEGNKLVAPAGESLSSLCNRALEAGLTGLEFAFGIPGSVGGAVYMNAGAYGGEMADVNCRGDGIRPCKQSTLHCRARELDLSYATVFL